MEDSRKRNINNKKRRNFDPQKMCTFYARTEIKTLSEYPSCTDDYCKLFKKKPPISQKRSSIDKFLVPNQYFEKKNAHKAESSEGKKSVRTIINNKRKCHL